jgi:hypothetical protein
MTLSTYTSPHTGTTYEVTETEVWYNEFNENGPFKVYKTEYNFCRDGKLVTLTFNTNESYLNNHFGVVEGIYQIQTSARD